MSDVDVESLKAELAAARQAQHEAETSLAALLNDKTDRDGNHSATLASVKQEHVDALAALKADHASTLEDLKREHSVQIEKLGKDHSAALTELKKEHEATLDNLKKDHSIALEAHKADLALTLKAREKSEAELATALKEKATVETHVSVIESELGRFKDQHAFASASKEALQKQLRDETVRRETAEEKHEAAQDKIELLRGQVEAARRGVMQLQKQHEQDRARRSTMTGGIESLEAERAEKEEKADRASRAAKRSSAYLGRRPLSGMSFSSETDAYTGPNGSGLRELRLGSGVGMLSSPVASSSRPSRTATGMTVDSNRASGLRSPRSPNSPPIPQTGIAVDLTHSPSKNSSDMDAGSAGGIGSRRGSDGDVDEKGSGAALGTGLRPQMPDRSRDVSFASEALATANAAAEAAAANATALQAARDENDSLRVQLERYIHLLAESEESREATEVCLHALREYMAEEAKAGGVVDGAPSTSTPGVTLSLPPLPTDKEADREQDEAEAAAQSRWGNFRLWGSGGAAGTGPKRTSTSTTTATDGPLDSPPNERQRDSLSPRGSFVSGTSGTSVAAALGIVEQQESSVDHTPTSASSASASVAAAGRSISSFFGRRRSGSKSVPAPAVQVDKTPLSPTMEVQTPTAKTVAQDQAGVITAEHPTIPAEDKDVRPTDAEMAALVLPPLPTEAVPEQEEFEASCHEDKARFLASPGGEDLAASRESLFDSEDGVAVGATAPGIVSSPISAVELTATQGNGRYDTRSDATSPHSTDADAFELDIGLVSPELETASALPTPAAVGEEVVQSGPPKPVRAAGRAAA